MATTNDTLIVRIELSDELKAVLEEARKVAERVEEALKMFRPLDYRFTPPPYCPPPYTPWGEVPQPPPVYCGSGTYVADSAGQVLWNAAENV